MASTNTAVMKVMPGNDLSGILFTLRKQTNELTRLINLSSIRPVKQLVLQCENVCRNKIARQVAAARKITNIQPF